MTRSRLVSVPLVVLGTVALGFGTLTAAETFRSMFDSSDSRYAYQSEASNEKEYNDYVKRGLSARAKSRIQKATQYFEGAAEESFAESPNYELWPDLAELYCAANRKNEGRALAREYSCAVDVMAGKKSCWIGDSSAFRVPNPALSPLCYARVCSVEYEAYYGQGRTNPRMQARDVRDRAIVEKLRSICSP